MNLSQLLSLGFSLAGGVASARVLQKRQAWEAQHNRVAICVDYDDALTAAIRANIAFDDILHRLMHSGATHISLPELTLTRLRHTGRLTPQAPHHPLTNQPHAGHWVYLHGDEPLVNHLACELKNRLPQTAAQVLEGRILAFCGDLPTIEKIGLGFEEAAAIQIKSQGLGIVPRPVSYDWPEPALIKRTLTQAAAYGDLIAFAGSMVLGHEMQLGDTVSAMTQHGLAMVYFVETRHQRGDWFIAKQRAPHVVLGYQFTYDDMMSFDGYAATYKWTNLATERGIRFCYVNFFRVLHASNPLEGLDYVHYLKHALQDAGYEVARDVIPPHPIPAPSSADLALVGLTAAGVSAAAVAKLLRLPDTLATPLTLLAAGGATALPFLEQKMPQPAPHSHDHGHGHHHHHHHDEHVHHEHHDHDEHKQEDSHHLDVGQFVPSYTPKLLGLATAALAPAAAMSNGSDPLATWAEGVIHPAAAAVSLAAVTSGGEYQLRVEEYRGFNLDWMLPLAAVIWQIRPKGWRAAALVGLLTVWWRSQKQAADPLADIDPAHYDSHTHHLSAATRLIGDVSMKLGPRPARKWAGLGPAAQATSTLLAAQGHQNGSVIAAVVSALGYALALVGFRRPERPLKTTLKDALPSFGIGAAIGLLLLLFTRSRSSDD